MKLFGLCALLTLAGCGTIIDMCSEQRVYGGFHFDAERVNRGFDGNGPLDGFGPAWILDLPASFAADTLLLPVTVPVFLVRLSRLDFSGWPH